MSCLLSSSTSTTAPVCFGGPATPLDAQARTLFISHGVVTALYRLMTLNALISWKERTRYRH